MKETAVPRVGLAGACAAADRQPDRQTVLVWGRAHAADSQLPTPLLGGPTAAGSSAHARMVQHTTTPAQQHQEAATPPPAALRDFATKAARHRFMIPADEVAALLAQAGCSMDTLLLSFLDEAAHDARPPISNYKVG